MDRFDRTKRLIGGENLRKIQDSFITVVGCGGVGGFVIESLVRSGVGKIAMIDKDKVDRSNINRQIIAAESVVGKSKVGIMEERIHDINPKCEVIGHNKFIEKNNINELVDSDCDYIVDTIDTVTSKLDLIEYCVNNNLNIISSMGMGNQISPYGIEVLEIEKTKNCPLAKIMRKKLKERGIQKVKVACRCSLPDKKDIPPSSIIFAPAIAGLKIGYYIIEELISR